MLVTPTPNYLIVLGFTAGGIARGMVVGLAVLFVSMYFGHIHIHNSLVIVTMAALTATLFALGGLINAVYAKNFDDISIIPTFILTPLTYLGGVFYSIEVLSDFWRNLSLINPILHLVNAFRYGFLGYSDVNISVSYAICVLFILAMYFLSLHLMEKGHGLRA